MHGALVPLALALLVLASGCIAPGSRDEPPAATTAPSAPTEPSGSSSDAPRPASGAPDAGALPEGAPPAGSPAGEPRVPIAAEESPDAARCGLDAANASPPRGLPVERAVPDPRPAPGERVRDPLVGASVTRVTDAEALGRPGMALDRAKATPWNADSSRLLVRSTDGYHFLFDAQGLAPLGALPLPLGDVEPRWSVASPDVLYFVFENRVCRLDLAAFAASVVVELSAHDRVTGTRSQDLLDLGNGEAALALLAFHDNASGEVDAIDLAVVSWREHANGSVEITRHAAPARLHERAQHGNLAPESVALARSFAVVGWSAPYSDGEAIVPIVESVRTETRKGLSLYSWDGVFERKMMRGNGDWSVCRDPRGRDVVAAWGANDRDPRDSAIGGVPLLALGVDAPTRDVAFVNDRALALRVACASGRDGWAFASSVDESHASDTVDPSRAPFVDKVLAVRLDADAPRVVTLADARTQAFGSDGTSRGGPDVRVAPSRDGNALAWAANFRTRVDDAAYRDVVIAEFPQALE